MQARYTIEAPVKDEIFKTKLAYENWQSKYQYGDETPFETQIRLARSLASVEKPEKQDYWFERFLNTLVKFDMREGQLVADGLKTTLGGRITANAGTHYKGTTLLNCFIASPVSDARIVYEKHIPNTTQIIKVDIPTQQTPDSLANIMLTALEQAETLKSEGGYGINFDFIRPRGALIKAVGIKHPGVVSYMKIWDTISEVIVKGDEDGYKNSLKNYLDVDINSPTDKLLKKMARKGAMMGCLTVDHPDIEEFIRAKQQPGTLTKFNISVLVTDEFMECVENDTLFDLQFAGKVYKRIRARELYDLIMQASYSRNEPGILFAGSMSRNNPLEYLGSTNGVNPCGEVPGNPYTTTVCLLGSLNLPAYVEVDRSFNWVSYKNDVQVFARMLDNVNDLSSASLPAYRWAIENVRQYGMGINGLGSALYMMGIAYNSSQAVELTNQLNWWKEELTWKTSALLAQEKGVFPAYNEQFLQTYWFTKFTRITTETKQLIRQSGVRNGKTTTNPPLGNTSIICDVVSNGIEPVFMHDYQRTYIANKWPDGLSLDNVKNVLRKVQQGDATVWWGRYNGAFYLYEPHNRGLCITETVRDFGYQWVLNHYPNDIGNSASYLVTIDDLTIDDHLQIQAATQQNLNQSVSKTANLPADCPFDDFKALYMKAWRLGLNGFTTYRAGTMEEVLSKIDQKEATQEISVVKQNIKLPDTFVNGSTRVIKREGLKFYINMSYLPEDNDMHYPVALWIHTNQKGETVAANAAVRALTHLLKQFGIDNEMINKQVEKIKGDPSHYRVAKMISMCLRHNLSILSIVMALENLEGDYVSSLLTATRKFLSEHIKDGTKMIGKNCPSCSGLNLVFQAGCSTCQDCGFSGCN